MSAVVHIIDELKVGGAQTHLATMLAYLAEYPAITHTIISLFGDGEIGDKLRTIGYEVIALDLRSDLEHRRFDLAIRQIKEVLEAIKPDLVEAHLTWSRLLGLFAAKLAGTPKRVGFEQGDINMHSLKFRIANFASQVYTDRYIVCSYALEQWVREIHHISKRKLTVLHNCVDTRIFDPKVAPAADILALREESNTVFAMVGSLGTGVNKRTDVGIYALATARKIGADVTLVIAGDGNQRSKLEQLATDFRVEQYVKFLGVRHDIPNILAACDVFCHAAPFEPFGIVAIEAMAMALPIVVPESGGIAETIQPMHTGLTYPALDVASLATAMVTLSSDPKFRKELGREARLSVLRSFTVESYIHRLYSLYGIEI